MDSLCQNEEREAPFEDIMEDISILTISRRRQWLLRVITDFAAIVGGHGRNKDSCCSGRPCLNHVLCGKLLRMAGTSSESRFGKRVRQKSYVLVGSKSSDDTGIIELPKQGGCSEVSAH